MSTAIEYENTYTYDTLNRLISVVQDEQSGGHAVALKRVEYVYNASSQVTYINRFETASGDDPALRTKFTYDSGGRVDTIQHRDVDSPTTSTLLNDYDYTYDNVNRITEIDSSEDGVSDYTFDAVGQLTDADHASGRTDESYTYDDTGNRTGGDYVVSSKNRTDESTGYEYEYDKEGNRTKRTDTSDDSYEVYIYDHRNRLTDVEFYNSSDVLTKSIEYRYDVFNRMVQRIYDSNGSSSGGVSDTWWAAFDGIHATLEFDEETATDITHRYLWGQYADDLLADEQVTSTSSEGDVLWALSDQVGTIRDIGEWDSTNSEFEITNHCVYNSFGELESESDSSVDLTFGFTGKWTEEDTGYTHHLNRWFDPEIGKWISEDPIGFAGGDMNISRYVANRVLSLIDPDGLDAEALPATNGAGSGEQQEDEVKLVRDLLHESNLQKIGDTYKKDKDGIAGNDCDDFCFMGEVWLTKQFEKEGIKAKVEWLLIQWQNKPGIEFDRPFEPPKKYPTHGHTVLRIHINDKKIIADPLTGKVFEDPGTGLKIMQENPTDDFIDPGPDITKTKIASRLQPLTPIKNWEEYYDNPKEPLGGTARDPALRLKILLRLEEEGSSLSPNHVDIKDAIDRVMDQIPDKDKNRK